MKQGDKKARVYPGFKIPLFSGVGYPSQFLDLCNWVFDTLDDPAAPCRLISIFCYLLSGWVGLSICFSGFCRIKVISENGSRSSLLWTLTVLVTLVMLIVLQAGFIFVLVARYQTSAAKLVLIFWWFYLPGFSRGKNELCTYSNFYVLVHKWCLPPMKYLCPK